MPHFMQNSSCSGYGDDKTAGNPSFSIVLWIPKSLMSICDGVLFFLRAHVMIMIPSFWNFLATQGFIDVDTTVLEFPTIDLPIV